MEARSHINHAMLQGSQGNVSLTFQTLPIDMRKKLKGVAVVFSEQSARTT